MFRGVIFRNLTIGGDPLIPRHLNLLSGVLLKDIVFNF
ncbi:MAG: DUF1581 domain-containing protein [Ruminococcaceae bacterium]|nr:DUF1581 domain-containing protein [Oscillospiraceae bacterium]